MQGMSETVAGSEDPINSNLTNMSEETEDSYALTYNHEMDYGFNEFNKTDQLDYDNPFNVPAVRITFIFLYSLVFACCFFGKCLQ